jgi:hypothetical protein
MLLLTFLAELAAVLLAMLQSSLLLQRSTNLWNSYCNQLRKRPLLTKAATGNDGVHSAGKHAASLPWAP